MGSPWCRFLSLGPIALGTRLFFSGAGCPVHSTGLSSSPGLHPPPCDNLEVSPHVAKGLLGDRTGLSENTSLRGRQTDMCHDVGHVAPGKPRQHGGKNVPLLGLQPPESASCWSWLSGLGCNITPQRALCSHPPVILVQPHFVYCKIAKPGFEIGNPVYLGRPRLAD